MVLTWWDAVSFVLFLGAVVGVSLYASRHERTEEDYFLAGRGLTWPLIGFSLIASNISTEQFVGMAGSGFGQAGLAVASYEWVAAATLVFVALVLLPRFLKLGIYTMPEFLEHRYGPAARTVMAVYMLVAYVGVAMAAVLYSGAIGLQAIFGLDLTTGIWLIGGLAGAYTIYGGLKAVVWSDLLQGAALLVGGGIVTVVALERVGGLSAFLAANEAKLHMVLPADHPELPWTALLIGIWIPNLFYWGFNQFITQRTLAARTLAQGQRGIVLAAALKLVIPFIIVFPGIIAFQLYGAEIANGDQAYPILISRLLPAGLRGVLFAALFGAVMSSLDSMLNSASTIYTMDVVKRWWRPDASPGELVRTGRVTPAVLVVLACLLAPLPGRFEGVFQYVQLVWGFISPGVVTVFLVGLLAPRVPAVAATAALLLGVPTYGGLLWALPEVAFLNHMAITAALLTLVMAVVTSVTPRSTPWRLQAIGDADGGVVDTTPDPIARGVGAVVVAATIGLYVVFW